MSEASWTGERSDDGDREPAYKHAAKCFPGRTFFLGAPRHHHNFDSRPEAQCELYGQVAVLHLDIGLVFPAPLSPIIEHLRTHVRNRVEYLTGLSVGKINIEISWLNPSSHVRKSLK